MRIRSRREEGQVYPALLLAVIGGFAIAVSFIPLQNLLDQTGRADSAADSAALAAADHHRDTWVRIPFVSPALASKLPLWVQKLRLAGTGAEVPAGRLARANGAHVVDFDSSRPFRFDFNKKLASYTVTTEQDDTVKGGDASVKSKSRARAVARVTNGEVLCGTNENPGIMLGGACRYMLTWPEECLDYPQNPNLVWCVLPFPTLEWEVRLVETDDDDWPF